MGSEFRQFERLEEQQKRLKEQFSFVDGLVQRVA
jgi:hypothetical protein